MWKACPKGRFVAKSRFKVLFPMLQPDMRFQDGFELIMVHVAKVISKFTDVIFGKKVFHRGIKTNLMVTQGICTMKVKFAHERVRGRIADFGVEKQYMQIHPELE